MLADLTLGAIFILANMPFDFATAPCVEAKLSFEEVGSVIGSAPAGTELVICTAVLFGHGGVFALVQCQ